MPSNARNNLDSRLRDIDQLLNAHSAITKFKNAERAAQNQNGQLAAIANVFNALITDPGRGKPKEVDALNRAAYVLLMAHFQGFVDELHKEVGLFVVGNKAADPEAVIKSLGNNRQNPHVNVITKMFAGLGLYDILETTSWQNCSNATVKSRLTNALERRNKIAHGGREPITKADIVKLKDFVVNVANSLDSQIKTKARALIGRNPW